MLEDKEDMNVSLATSLSRHLAVTDRRSNKEGVATYHRSGWPLSIPLLPSQPLLTWILVWYRLSREAVKSSFLDIFKSHLNTVMGNWI